MGGTPFGFALQGYVRFTITECVAICYWYTTLNKRTVSPNVFDNQTSSDLVRPFRHPPFAQKFI